MKKETILRLLSIGLGVGLPLVMIEIALRILPVYSSLHTQPVNDANPAFHFAPDRDVTWSTRWNFVNRTPRHVNNAGFLHDQDYVAKATSPLLAVIGDSYIEALMVKHPKTMQGRLAADVAKRGRVYSFAASGAPLSQYLAWAAHARKTYRPRGMVINVVGNDYDESVTRYKSAGGFHYYHGKMDDLRWKLVPYEPSLKGKIAREFALFRYLAHHLHVHLLFQKRRAKPKPGSVRAQARAVARLKWSKLAVDAFLRDLPGKAGLLPSRIVIVVDALRGVIYDPATRAKTEAAYAGQMRAYMLLKSREAGFEVIDLQPAMTAHFKQTGQKMEAYLDWHWSGVGHGVAAAEVRKSNVYRTLFKGPAAP